MTGEELKTILKYRGVAMTELAEKLGLNYRTLQGRLKVRTVKTPLLNSIAEVLGIDPKELTGDDNTQKKEVASLASILKGQMELQESLLKTLKEQQDFFKEETAELRKENKLLKEKIDEISRKEENVNAE